MRIGPLQIQASVDYDPGGDVDETPGGELATWTNVALTNAARIRWDPNREYPDIDPDGDPDVVGRLVIGAHEQLVLDMTGSAIAKMLTALRAAQKDIRSVTAADDAGPGPVGEPGPEPDPVGDEE